MASSNEELHNDVTENNVDDPKRMSARYNLFRYKSKEITDMTYNGELVFSARNF
jgi:hypothetical protein